MSYAAGVMHIVPFPVAPPHSSVITHETLLRNERFVHLGLHCLFNGKPRMIRHKGRINH